MEDGSEIFKNTNQITQTGSPSPKVSKQKINSYINLNNKSSNSKYETFSSIKKRNNPSKNNTIDSEKNKVLFEDDEDEQNCQMLSAKVRIQNKTLEEYQKWINILLSVIDSKRINNTYNDVGTPIQQGLNHIEKIKDENLKIKTLIINQKEYNDNIEKILDKKIKTQNMVIKEFNEKDKNNELNLKKEKEQLILNVQMLANELDELNENNKQLYDKIQKDNNLKKIYELYNIKNQLKEENKLYKKIMVFKNRKDYINLQESLSLSSNKFSLNDKIKKNFNNMGSTEYSIGRLSGYGEYKLEKEENINTTDSIFFCGL